MSSIIERSTSSAATPSNGQAGSRIVHFDATVRRKERMRQRATTDIESTAAAKPAPTPPAPTPPAAEPKRNGAFAHPAANTAPAPTPATAAPAPVQSNGAASQNGAARNKTAPTLPSGAELEKFLVDFVVEQTGYPEEMVELDADLEADLGIDSIKKAQLFGELAERFEIDVQGAGAEELSLDDFPTLRHVKSFLENADTAAASPAPTPVTPPAASPPEPASPPAPAPVAPTPQPVSPVSQAASLPEGAELEQFLISFVVEQTGYPEEMVELDADLEADLGIDSIKKAQLFGELAEQFQIDVQGADASELSLDDFPTLRHVMAFLQDAPAATAAPAPQATTPAPAAAPTPAPAAAPASVSTPAPVEKAPAPKPATSAALPQGPELEKFLIDFVVEQTGYPEEMVELDADLEADLGIDSIKKAQLFGELAEQFQIDVQGADASELSLDDFPTLRHVMAFLQDAPAAQASPAPVAAVSATPPAAPAPTPAPVPSTPPAPQSAAPTGATMSGAELEAFLVNFVVEQTGYPPEMVEMDADLEADLGIDSIKKAQLFGELAEQFEVNLESAEELSLDDFPTLRHVMKFLEGVPQKATA